MQRGNPSESIFSLSPSSTTTFRSTGLPRTLKCHPRKCNLLSPSWWSTRNWRLPGTSRLDLSFSTRLNQLDSRWLLIFENQISNGFLRTWHFNLLLAWISLPKATNDFVNPSRDPTSPPSTNPTAWEVTLVILSSLFKFIRFRLVTKQQPSVLNLIWVNRKDRVLFKSKLLSNLILLNNRNHHLL